MGTSKKKLCMSDNKF